MRDRMPGHLPISVHSQYELVSLDALGESASLARVVCRLLIAHCSRVISQSSSLMPDMRQRFEESYLGELSSFRDLLVDFLGEIFVGFENSSFRHDSRQCIRSKREQDIASGN